MEEHQREFLHRTEQLLKGHSKLVSNLYQKDTIARWIKQVLEAAGIEIKKYSAHSSRAASTSSCKAKGLNLAAIMKSAGWSNLSTVARFYDKPVDTTQANFGSVLFN